MPMTPLGRRQALYAAIAQANPKVASMTPDEQIALQNNLQAIFGADLTYIQQNAEVDPTALVTPQGATVATSGSQFAQSGYVTAATAVTGTGTIR